MFKRHCVSHFLGQQSESSIQFLNLNGKQSRSKRKPYFQVPIHMQPQESLICKAYQVLKPSLVFLPTHLLGCWSSPTKGKQGPCEKNLAFKLVLKKTVRIPAWIKPKASEQTKWASVPAQSMELPTLLPISSGRSIQYRTSWAMFTQAISREEKDLPVYWDLTKCWCSGTYLDNFMSLCTILWQFALIHFINCQRELSDLPKIINLVKEGSSLI